MNACDMVNRCYRHQNPDFFGGVESPPLPASEHNTEYYYTPDASILPEEEMGSNEARTLAAANHGEEFLPDIS